MGRPTAAISWSGGKDSCAAYHRARADFDIVAAITMFNEDGTRSRSHGLRPEILAAQVERLGLRAITQTCAWDTYDSAFDRALAEAADDGHHARRLRRHPVRRASRVGRAAERGRGLTAVEPLWKESTTDLYREFLASGTRARIVTVRIEQARRVVSRPRSGRRSPRRVRRARRRSLRRAWRISHASSRPVRRSRSRCACARWDAPPTADASPKIWCSMSEPGLAAEGASRFRFRGKSARAQRRERAHSARRPRRHPRPERLGQDDAASTAGAACCAPSSGRIVLDGVDLQRSLARPSPGAWRWCRRKRSSRSSTRCSRWR